MFFTGAVQRGGPGAFYRHFSERKQIVVDDFLKELEELNATSMLRNDYTKTLALLRALKAGKVSLEQVTMTADGWQVSAIQLADDASEPTEAAEEPA